MDSGLRWDVERRPDVVARGRVPHLSASGRGSSVG